MRNPIPLRYAFPIGLLGLCLALIAISAAINRSDLERRNEELMRQRMIGMGVFVAADVRHAVAEGEQHRLPEILGRLASIPHLEWAVLCDAAGRVRYRRDVSPAAETLAELDPAAAAALARSVAETGVAIAFSADQRRLLAVFPTGGKTATEPLWFCTASDVALQKAPEIAALNRSLAVMAALGVLACAALWFYFDRTVTRRAAALVAATRQLAEGRPGVSATVSGADELAQIGAAFDRMAAEIGRNAAHLRESEERLSLAVAGGELGVWDVNLVTGEVNRSEHWTRMLGYGPDEIPARLAAWEELLHPDDRAQVLDAFRAHADGRTAFYQSEHRLRHREGTWVWVLDRGRVVQRDENGRPVRAVGVCRDVTARREAVDALRQSEHRFRELTENIEEVFWVMSADRREVLYVSPAYERVWGQPRGDLRSAHERWRALVHPADRARVEAQVANPPPAGGAEMSYRIVRPGGAVRWIQDRAFPVTDETGRLLRIVGVAQDVTSRREAEDAARRLAEFPELNPSPVFELTADGAVGYCNAAARTLAAELGCPRPEGMLPDGFATIVRDCLADRQSLLRVETPVARRLLQWSFHPIPQHAAVHAYATDVTERRLLEEQYRQSQKMEAVGQLAGGVAHDFNNMLTAILMHAQLAQEEPGVPERSVESLAEIVRVAERSAGLTRQLLLFSRREVMQQRDLDLNGVVGGTARLLQRLLGEDVRLQVEMFPGPLPVHADAGMLDQVLLNLAVNARDAMPGGGLLCIETAAIEVPAVGAGSPPATKPGRYARLTVRDTGQGIPADVLPHIFEPFFTTKATGKGTGLGLATVFGIAQQHGGYVGVRSEPGRGATFDFLLPLLPATEPAAGPRPLAPAIAGGRETILLVEDETVIRHTVKQILELHGYRVLTAADGFAALGVWAQHGPTVDLLLTDLVMPEGIGGRELAERLQRAEPRLRVILTSGYSSQLAGRELALGPTQEFLGKPFGPEELLTIVRRVLDR